MNISAVHQNIPSGWRQVRLGDVYALELGIKAKEGEFNYLEIGDVDINEKDYNLSGKAKTTIKGAVKVPKETLLISRVRPTRGAITVTKSEINVSPAFTRIKLKNRYLYFIVTQDKFLEYLGAAATGSTYPTCKDEDVLNFKFLYTPIITEQQKIADILGTVDEDIVKTEELIKAIEKLKRGLMQQLFTRGIDDGIEESILGDISMVTSSKRIMRSEYVEDGIPFYRSKEVIEKAKGINHGLVYYISKERFEEIEQKFGAPHIGDILMTAVGTIGVVYLVDEEGFYFKDGNLLWIKDIDKSLDKSYLKYYMNSEIFQKRVLGTAIGSNQKALTIEKVERVIVPIPKLPEQQKIAEILSAVDEKISVNKKLKEKLTLLKKGLMQDLLSGRVRIN